MVQSANDYQIFDADGHVREDLAAVAEYLPAPYLKAYRDGLIELKFPPFDHFHGASPMISPSHGRGQVGPNEWLGFLKDVNIEKTVLYPTAALAYGRFRDLPWTVAVCRAYNDWITKTYLDFDRERFTAMAILPMQDPAAASQELERAVNDLGMPGAMLPSHGLAVNLGAAVYWPVYETADRLGCCLATHGACHDGFGFDDINIFAPAHAMGHAFGQVVSMSSMLFGGVFERFQNVRFAFLEGGIGWFLMALERFGESFAAAKPFGGDDHLAKLITKGADKYLLEMMEDDRLFIGCEGGERDIKYMVEHVTPKSLMYSSDFPHEVTVETCLHEIGELHETGLRESEVRGILRDNAVRFYQL